MSLSQDQVREESLWFGSKERPLFARLASPTSTTSRGGVLISPPIGREARLARRALRNLAILLASDGYVTLRLDHYATGNSSGSFDDLEFDLAWREGIDQAIALLRTFGVSSVSAVGMRIGATIIAAAAHHELGLESAVLWDPCESGRHFLRESSALGALGHDDEAPGSGEPAKRLEYSYSEEASKRLRDLNFDGPMPSPLAERLLVVVRDDRVVSSKFRSIWTEDVEWTTTSEQGPLLETELPTSVQPLVTIAEIREWLTRPNPPAGALAERPATQESTVMRAPGGPLVRERIAELGPNKLFGVLCEPVEEAAGPIVVLVNGFNEDHVGPSRLWVDLSRLWAGAGLRCLRFDLRELGESPWLPGQPDPSVFDKTRPDDVRDVARAVDPDGAANAVLVGLCAGALVALGVALESKSRGLCMINPQVGTGILRSANRLETSERQFLRSLARRGENILKRHRWIGKMVWQVSRLVLPTATSPKVRSTLVKNGTEMLLLASPDDFSPFPRMPIIGSIDRRRLVSSEHYRIEVITGMDHDFLNDVGRARAVEILQRHVLETFGPRPTA